MIDRAMTTKDTILVIQDLGSYFVDNIEYVSPQYQEAYTENAMRPDPSWKWRDPAGHLHTWTISRKKVMTTFGGVGNWNYAIKRRETVKCDGSCGNWDCDGWDRWAWNCRECGALIQPGYVPDNRTHRFKISEGYAILDVRTDGAMMDALDAYVKAKATILHDNKAMYGTVYPSGGPVQTYHRSGSVNYSTKVRFEFDAPSTGK